MLSGPVDGALEKQDVPVNNRSRAYVSILQSADTLWVHKRVYRFQCSFLGGNGTAFSDIGLPFWCHNRNRQSPFGKELEVSALYTNKP